MVYCAGDGGVSLSLEGLTVTGGLTYQWKKTGTAAAVGTSATLTGATAGEYVCTITRTQGGNVCTHTTQAVTVVENPLPTYTITGDGEYCPTETTRTPVEITFTGKAPITFTIANQADFTANGTGLVYTSTAARGTNAPGQKYQPTAITDDNGCSAAPSTASVTVINKTVEGLTAEHDSLCFGTAATLNVASLVTAAGSSTPTFEMKPGSAGTITPAGVLTLSTAAPATHYIIAKLPAQAGATCPSEVEFTVKTLALPTVDINTNDVCFGTASALSVTQTNTGAALKPSAGYTWDISTGGTLTSTTVAAPSITNTTPAGIYTVGVRVTDANECVSERKTKTVEIYAKPVIALSADDDEFCVNDAAGTITAAVTIGSTATSTGTGTWSGLYLSDETNFTAKFNTATATTAAGTVITYNYTSATNCAADPKTITMTVHPLPNFSIAPSKADACSVDVLNTAETITMVATPAQSGTFVYTSSDVTITDASTGTFSTAGLAPGVKTINLAYTDGESCEFTTSGTFTINPLPTVAITTTTTEVCWNAGEITLAVSPAAGSGNNFSFTGADASGKFTANASGGTHNFVYNYTDLNGCIGEDDHSITSIFVTEPARIDSTQQINSANTFNPGVTTDLEATLPAGADAIEWFAEGDCGGNIEYTGLTYVTGVVADDGEGTYTYAIRSKQAIAGGTCYSTCAPAILNITACPALTPEAKNAHYCLGEKSGGIKRTGSIVPSKRRSFIRQRNYLQFFRPGRRTANRMGSRI